MIPSLFVAHGSPMLAIEENSYTRALQKLGKQLKTPAGIVLFSAHWVSTTLTITYTDERYETIYDFMGFPPELYQVTYPARGATRVAEQLQQLLEAEGIEVKRNRVRGLDHGAWVILRHLFPEANIPVVNVSVNPYLPPEEQYQIGKAISSLPEQNILVIGSGATVHNLFQYPGGERDKAVEFDDWLMDHMKKWDTHSLFSYNELAPHADYATPDYEHFLPLFIAMGAGDKHKKATLLHQSYPTGSLSHVLIRFD